MAEKEAPGVAPRTFKRTGGKQNDYIAKLHVLTEKWLNGSEDEFRVAIPAFMHLPTYAAVAWIDRKAGARWPEGAPWVASEPWARMALVLESEGARLFEACDQVMLGELERGNGRPVAQWFEVARFV